MDLANDRFEIPVQDGFILVDANQKFNQYIKVIQHLMNTTEDIANIRKYYQVSMIFIKGA